VSNSSVVYTYLLPFQLLIKIVAEPKADHTVSVNETKEPLIKIEIKLNLSLAS